MEAGGARITIEFQVQTRRKSGDDYTPFRTVFTGTEEEAKKERQAHIDSGYNPERLRIIRATTIEEVW
jgi:hypothetical protein